MGIANLERQAKARSAEPETVLQLQASIGRLRQALSDAQGASA
jgi:hypothetical protein